MAVLDKVCGEANKQVFIGFTDLFQEIANFFIPDFWPFNVLEDIFNNIFDTLQKKMEPIAYEQGAAMGLEIEKKVTAWIKSQFDEAIKELEKVKKQALDEIAEAERLLREHADKIQNLLDRVNKLEGETQRLELLQRRVI